ncbi:MAG TPA: hypothetical protein VEI03_15770 [Stellaceae bacterium]|nr:hypothetical protein [Stellaceae bacterium]
MPRSFSCSLLLVLLALFAPPVAAKGGISLGSAHVTAVKTSPPSAAPPRFVALTPLIPWGYPGQANQSPLPAAAAVETTPQGVTIVRGPGAQQPATTPQGVTVIRGAGSRHLSR